MIFRQIPNAITLHNYSNHIDICMDIKTGKIDNMLVDELIIVTDGSVNTRLKIGYGAYLAVSEPGLSLDALRKRVKVRRFEHTSSTKLELQTLLWALNNISALGSKVIIYTDSQNIVGLPGRRERFEKNNYRSKKNRLINNYELYQEFYRITDKINCKFFKVHGHQTSNKKDDIDRLFTLVDRTSRNSLRKHIREAVVLKPALLNETDSL